MTKPILLLASVSAIFCVAAHASEPASHDVTAPDTAGQTVVVEWTGVTPAGASGAATNTCSTGTTATEDGHIVNLTVPEGTYDDVNITAVFHIEWETAGSDLVLTVNYEGAEAGSSDGGSPEENVSFANPSTGEFDARSCAFAATADTPYLGRLTLTATAKGANQSPDAGTGNAVGAPPRFQNYAPDYAAQGFGMFGGEATMDVNTQTGSLFYIGFLETLRIQMDDSTSPAIDTWENKSGTLTTLVTSDPILVGDRDTGRIFAQQLLVGEGQALSEFTDDDGESWSRGGEGAVARSGADHQALVVGPYPEGSLIPHPLYPNAVYYCSQDIAAVYCSRSDDGGVTFNPSVVVYTLNDCQGLHGHIKIAPDGTAYLPVAGCPSPIVDAANSVPAVVVSEDAGLTWEVREITTAEVGAGGHGSDPSVGISDGNVVYIGYFSNLDKHLHIAKSVDRGVTWTNDVDLGELGGITAGEFPAVVAGDDDRASVAFFGTTFTGEGDSNGESFGGKYHLYAASTYDGGATYHIVNVTPNDPVQVGGLCSGGFCRNLLDFFDSVIDTEGRVLISYEDGCIGGCPAGAHPTFTDQAVIARQSGGPRLYAAFDPTEPAAPGSPLVDGFRNEVFAQLEWPEPDGAGAAINNYTVYRGTAPTALSAVGSTGTNRMFVDTGLDADQTYYYAISATNSEGESPTGNVIELAQGTNVPDRSQGCALPGIQMAIDSVGEAEAGNAASPRDITAVFVAEPEDMPGMIAFTLANNVFTPPDQGGNRFRVRFYVAPAGDLFELEVTQTGSQLRRHIPAPNTGNLDGREDLGDLELKQYNTDGSVTMIVAKERLGIAKGDTLLQVHALSYPGASTSNILTEEAGYFDYTLAGNDFCSVTQAPVPPTTVTPGASVEGGGGASGVGMLAFLFGAGWMRRLMRKRSRSFY